MRPATGGQRIMTMRKQLQQNCHAPPVTPSSVLQRSVFPPAFFAPPLVGPICRRGRSRAVRQRRTVRRRIGRSVLPPCFDSVPDEKGDLQQHEQRDDPPQVAQNPRPDVGSSDHPSNARHHPDDEHGRYRSRVEQEPVCLKAKKADRSAK